MRGAQMTLWRVRLLAVSLLAGTATMTALAADPGPAPAGCPDHLTENGKFHMLLGMKVFDGPPGRGPEVMPEVAGRTSTWDIANVRAAGTAPGVLCSYKHTGKTLTYTVPGDVKACVFTSGYPAQTACR